MEQAFAHAEMLIHKPVSTVFDAMVNPAVLESFWLRKATGPLAEGAKVQWEFLVPGAHESVTVNEFVANEVIEYTWSDGICVRMDFHSVENTSTRLSVTATGFHGPDATAQAVNATEGFTIVLCDLKSLLESGRSGNMVRDKAALITAAMHKD
jgi:uncharacterized protein YndB with AHSA1/START domain